MMQGYVLSTDDGEHMFQSRGEIVVKVDPTRGSNELALGTQRMPLGVGVPPHVHAYWDETAYVLDGNGYIILDGERIPIQKGDTVFVPKGTSHAYENPDSEMFLMWIVAPTGQEEFFRAISSRPGEPAKNLSRDEVLAIRQQVEAEHLKRVQPKS
ncbi:MAG TPA: cupin domain-containing protein [Acetobacteraceae bacterium]|nr:cupin domain-containing protein [Acetobacteraceae bacterium]